MSVVATLSAYSSSALAAMDQLNYSNQSAQPHQSGSSAVLHQLSYHNQSAQLQYISSPAATSQLVCSGAAYVYIGRSVSAELQCVGSSAMCNQLACWQGSAGLSCQPASENIEQPFVVITWQLTQLGLLFAAED